MLLRARIGSMAVSPANKKTEDAGITAVLDGKVSGRQRIEQSPPSLGQRSLVLELARLVEAAWRWPVWRSGSAFRAMCCLLFVVALWRFSRPFDPNSQVTGTGEPVNIALHLLAGRGFSGPFASHFTGPTAHAAPVFPFFLAGLWQVFGLGATGHFAFRTAGAAALAAQIALLPVLGRALGMHALVGLIAALLSMTPRTLQTFPDWEANYVALLVMLVTWGVCRMIQGRERPLYHSVLLAFLWGVLLLANPNALLPYWGWLAWLAFFLPRSRLPKGRRGASLTLMAVIPALVLLPWTLRNHSVFGEWFFVRDDLGLELMVSNNPCAQFGARLNQSSGCYDTVHPQENAAIAQRLQEMGEVAFNLELREKAVEWVRRDPWQFLNLTLQRTWFFWFPSTAGDNLQDLLSTHTLRSLVLYSTTLLSISGLLWLLRKNRAGAVLCLLWLGCFPLIHYVVQFEDRYRTPILWITFLLAAFALLRAGLWIMRRVGFPESSVAPGENGSSLSNA
ncbi:MAG: hypothetical protein L0387_40670 [Acidobacteria bacterium]|nr:hypothetical protein [Acidobacteriota bacterium]